MVEKAEAVVRLELPSERESRIVYGALKPETESPPSPRSRVYIELDGRTLTLKFEATDTTALRAALNSYLRWIMLVDNLYSTVESLLR